MPDIEEKLKSFAAIVMEDAEKQRKERLAELEKKKKKRIERKENEILADAYEQIQQAVARKKRENGERALKIETEVKKELILFREEIIDRVFSKVHEKLVEFTSSADYQSWLVKRTIKASVEVGKGKKVIYLSSGDMKFKEAIEKCAPEAEVICDSDGEDFIGGVKVFNSDKNLFVNYSIKDMLDEKRSVFLQESGMSIY